MPDAAEARSDLLQPGRCQRSGDLSMVVRVLKTGGPGPSFGRKSGLKFVDASRVAAGERQVSGLC